MSRRRATTSELAETMMPCPRGVKGRPGHREDTMRLNKKVSQLIERERVCRVATVSEDGVPHVVPVCSVLHDGKIYFGSGRDGRKIKNLETNPRCAITVDLYTEDWGALRGVMVQGDAA